MRGRGWLHTCTRADLGQKRPARRVALAVAFVVAVAACTAPAALALPEGRVYEMVSPPYKGGFGATHIEAVAENGESVAYFSPGAFAGAPAGFGATVESLDYLARRGASGWSTTPIMPPDMLVPFVSGSDVSPSLNLTFVLAAPGSSEETGEKLGSIQLPLVHVTDTPDVSANWELDGEALEFATPIGQTLFVKYLAATPDFCHVLINSPDGPLLLQAKGAYDPIYEVVGGCGGTSPTLRLVSVDNTGSIIGPLCPATVGLEVLEANESTQISRGINVFNALSADGSEAFFTACAAGNKFDHQLFVRLGGSRTIEVSRPLSEKCDEESELPCKGAASRASASFAGAAEDGSRVFFTSKAALTEEDTDVGNDLYMASIGCPAEDPQCEASERTVTSLVQVSHDPNAGEAAEVHNVVRVAPDGRRVYFVAGGDLLDSSEREALEAEGRAVPHTGAENLYVYDDLPGEAAKVVFIGEACTGHQLSGSSNDVQCAGTGSDELELLGGTASVTSALTEAQTAGPNGQFLVFSTYAQLTGDDTDTAKDVYRYDAATGALERVSIGENGYDSEGNNDKYDATIHPVSEGGSSGNIGPVEHQYNLGQRAISEDGSRIVFTTADPLSPLASNGLVNVYEWHEGATGGAGSVSLVSSGTGEQPVEDAVISPDGGNIFFDTVVGLAPQDTDGAPDIYDARLGGGFPAAPAPPRACSGEACYGSLTNPAPLLVPGSVPQAAGGNFPAPAKATIKTGKKAKAKKGKAKRRKSKEKREASGRSGKAKKAGRSGR
jgi:hypothetical protein